VKLARLPRQHLRDADFLGAVIFPADRIAVRDSERAYVEVMLHEWIVNDSARVRLTATIERAISNFTAQLPVSFRFVTGD
jgi:hypothetical protein